jgi:hypothetical protein
MKTLSMADYPNLGEHPAYQAAAGMLVNLVSQRDAAQTALENLQRKATPGMAPPQALAAQIRNQQQAVHSFNAAFAMIAGGMPLMLAGGKSNRHRP